VVTLICRFLYGEQARCFDDEFHPKLKHDKVGMVAMASAGENANASQFYFTTRAELDYLDGKHTVFGEVAEGLDTLMRINEAFVDENHKPYKNIRIKHTHILDDPFDDPAGLAGMIPDRSPELKPPSAGEEVRLEDDWVPMDQLIDPEELDITLRRKEAQSRAVVLEMIGDIPDAELKPPENVLFVCKLNPVTEEGDLEIIFGRFGKVISADIIRDYKTGDSLCYAFIEFDSQEGCEAAYCKMDNVLIDDRRIHVDFSQSVSRLWNRYRKFGTKSSGEGVNFAPGNQGKGRGCFKCGEEGHFAKECPNDGSQKDEGVPERPKYSIKDTDGQHGNMRTRYDMVFEEEGGAHESRSHARHSSASAGLPDKGARNSDKEDRRNSAINHSQGLGEQDGGRMERDRERFHRDSRHERDIGRHHEHKTHERDTGLHYKDSKFDRDGERQHQDSRHDRDAERLQRHSRHESGRDSHQEDLKRKRENWREPVDEDDREEAQWREGFEVSSRSHGAFTDRKERIIERTRHDNGQERYERYHEDTRGLELRERNRAKNGRHREDRDSDQGWGKDRERDGHDQGDRETPELKGSRSVQGQMSERKAGRLESMSQRDQVRDERDTYRSRGDGSKGRRYEKENEKGSKREAGQERRGFSEDQGRQDTERPDTRRNGGEKSDRDQPHRDHTGMAFHGKEHVHGRDHQNEDKPHRKRR
jgi:peptidyl-prolyl cis-trans isomerase-like 4